MSKNKKPVYKRAWFIVVVVFVLLAAIGSQVEDDQMDTIETSTVEQSNATEVKDTVEKVEQSNVTEVNKADEKVEEVKNEPKSTVSQKNALKKAKNYISFSAFSRGGLIKQLEFEGFSNEDATYGVDNCKVDWMEQAVKKAKKYLDTSAFSRDGLVHQLEFEDFTAEQAAHGADNSGADWMEQAVKKAKIYLDTSAFSRKGLIDQLKFEKFTEEQAIHGVDGVGLK